MVPMTVASSKPIVVSADEMDSATFRRHMNHRHLDSLGYAGRLPRRVFGTYSDYIEHCYRAFHSTLHRLRLDIEHEHQDS
jgi:hypothetical protein